MSSERLGIVIVDHGSRRQKSNDLLLEVVALFERHTGFEIVEPAHMELAEPSIRTAFDRCVRRGANLVVVHPYFLLPGRHWQKDIPALTANAAAQHPGVRFLVTAPLGLHELMAEVMKQRVEHCLAQARGDAEPCDVCVPSEGCHIRSTDEDSPSDGNNHKA
jgi:sirohydrochlorin ferrochelatase